MGKMPKNQGGRSKDVPCPCSSAARVVMHKRGCFSTEEPATLSLNHPLAHLKYSGYHLEKAWRRIILKYSVWLKVQRKAHLKLVFWTYVCHG